MIVASLLLTFRANRLASDTDATVLTLINGFLTLVGASGIEEQRIVNRNLQHLCSFRMTASARISPKGLNYSAAEPAKVSPMVFLAASVGYRMS